MRRSSCVLIVLLALGARPGRAESTVEQLPGYVDLNGLGLPSTAEASVEVNLRGPLLRLIGAASRGDEPEFAEMIDKLQLIRVQVFPLKSLGSAVGVQESINLLGSRVEQQGWERVVRVREQSEQAHVYLKLNGEQITGLLVMAIDDSGKGDDEVVFVNIVGNIDPEQIGRLGRQLNISPLDSIRLDQR